MSSWAGHTGPELAEAWGVPLVEAYETIESTNDRAAQLAREDDRRPAVVIADEQTAGRGRRGDRWQSSPGSGIWMSVLVDSRSGFPQLPLVVGVACARAAERVMVAGARARITVKWPNDLLLDGRKVGGILCESGPFGVAIGVGLNIRRPDAGFDGAFAPSATALEDHGVKLRSVRELAGALVTEIVDVVSRPNAFSGVRDELGARDALLGRRITTEISGVGVARGVADDGSLLLERADGSVTPVHSGSVRLTEPLPSG